MTAMERDEVAALILRWQSAFQERNPAALAPTYAENAVLESPTYGTILGRSAIRRSADQHGRELSGV
jgi:ketosteroid isomerase-like protein